MTEGDRDSVERSVDVSVWTLSLAFRCQAPLSWGLWKDKDGQC